MPGSQSQAGTAIQKATPAPPPIPVAGDAPAKSQALAAVSFAMSLLGWAVRTGHVVITKTTSVRAKSISQPQSPDIIDADFTTPATTGRQQTKSCPFCGEEILAVARKCKHCGETLDPVLRATEEGRRAPAIPLYQPPAAPAGPINVTVNPTFSQNVDVKTTTTTIVAGAVKPKSGGCCGCLILIVIAFFAMAFLGRGGTSSPGGAGNSATRRAGATVQQPSNVDTELPSTEPTSTESGSLENSTDSPPTSSQPAPAQSQSNSSYFGNGGGASHRLRTWTYEDGTELRASFVSFANGQVTLRTEDGKTVKTAIDKLSASDQRDIHHVRVD